MSDMGREWTDEQLELLERRFASAYSQAAREMQGKLEKALSDYGRENSQRLKALDGTPEAKKAYEDWRRSQAVSQRWMGDMVRQLSESATHANMHAMDMVNDFLPHVYAENANISAFALDKQLGYDTGFTLVNEDAVRYLMGLPLQDVGDDQLLREVTWTPDKDRTHVQDLRKREVDYPKDMRWNREKFQSAITQGILQGESIPNIVKRTKDIYGRNKAAATRAARTATTNAENAGRMSTFERAQSLGIDMELEWLATLDGRTRSSHRALDGQRIQLGEKFSNGLRWPGDPQGPADELWNCRCRANGRVVGFDGKRGDWADERGERWTRLPKGMTYDEWKTAKAVSRDKSYENESDRKLGYWPNSRPTASVEELQALAKRYEDEVTRLANDLHVPSRELYDSHQEYVDKYAQQMRENEWAKDLDLDKLSADVDRLYEEQSRLYDKREELRSRRRELIARYDDKSLDEYERLREEIRSLGKKYDSCLEEIDDAYRKIDAKKTYDRAKRWYEEYKTELDKKLSEYNQLVEKAEEARRLLPEARKNRNQAYAALSEAQPFAPQVREVLGDEYADRMRSMVDEAGGRHPEIAGLYKMFSSQLKIIEKNLEEGAFYRSSDRGIHFNAKNDADGSRYEAPYQTLFHEFGHLIDHVGGFGDRYTSNSGNLEQVIKKDWASFRNAEGQRLGVTRNKNEATIDMLMDEVRERGKLAYGDVSDIIEGCTKKSYPLGIGHGASYHKRDGATEREFFAEVCDSAMRNEDSYGQMRRIFPHAVDLVEKMAREILGL